MNKYVGGGLGTIVCSALLLLSANTATAHNTSIDWIEFHSDMLRAQGVEDLSNGNLARLLNETENFAIKIHIIHLLGRKGLKESIPVIYPFLSDEILRIEAADALRMLGDLRGLPMLEEICARRPDSITCLHAADVLAKSGRMIAYKYLKKFLKHERVDTRHNAAWIISDLAGAIDQTHPDQSRLMVDDIVTHLYEIEDMELKRWATEILRHIKVKDKAYVVDRLKEIKADLGRKEKYKGLLPHIDNSIDCLKEEIKSQNLKCDMIE